MRRDSGVRLQACEAESDEKDTGSFAQKRGEIQTGWQTVAAEKEQMHAAMAVNEGGMKCADHAFKKAVFQFATKVQFFSDSDAK